MKNIMRIICFIFILLSLFLCSWYVLHKDIHFQTDIARDFLLFGEISRKKIVLIGPRSSAGGLYHGPLWLYLTYPGYLLGSGDPVIVGWYWIFLIVCYLIGSFYIAKRLFDEKTAYVFVLLSSVQLIVSAKELFNPYGAFFVMPVMFFFFIRYLETRKFQYLLFHVAALGAIIQFQMAIGIPLTILSLLFILVWSFKHRILLHMSAYVIILICISNFIIFDLRHQFILTNAVLHNMSPAGGNSRFSFLSLLHDRFDFFFNTSLLSGAPQFILTMLCLIYAFFLILQIKNNKNKLIYLSFLYFYAGYFLISLASRNNLLVHQYLPIISLVYLIFASFITSRFSKIFILIFIAIYIFDLIYAFQYIGTSKNFIGKDPESWNFLFSMSKKIYQSKDKDSGYFVYSPDSFGYQPKYAMMYAGKFYPGKAHYLMKKTVTYVVSANPPPDNPYMQDTWWIKNILHITKDPQSVITFHNGYKIKRYILTDEEVKIPFDPNIDVGLHFR